MSSGHAAALEGVAVATRADRARVRVDGRDPVAMLQGILTNRVPEAPEGSADGVVRGVARYAAVLTPKGRIVADPIVLRGPREEDGLLLDLAAPALPGLLDHLRTYVPPRFARVADVTSATGALTVVGPGAAELLSREALGLRIETEELASLDEGAWVWLDTGERGMLVRASGDVAAPGFDVVADRETAQALASRLVAAGAAPLSPTELEVLRVEAGRPSWGSDMDAGTLPPEAGIEARAVDHTKGCYTGQEVIVRIRDRGHVNRRLRGLVLGDVSAPPAGTELWAEGHDRSVGSITTVVHSPRAGGLALAWLRREVEVPGTVRLGGAEGPAVDARELGDDWWRPPTPEAPPRAELP